MAPPMPPDHQARHALAVVPLMESSMAFNARRFLFTSTKAAVYACSMLAVAAWAAGEVPT